MRRQLRRKLMALRVFGSGSKDYSIRRSFIGKINFVH
jgi:hypothetical protein